MPIKSIAIVLAGIGFLNEGKFEMRARYWEKGYVSTGISGLPTLYADWVSASFDSVFGREDSRRVEGQKFLNRIDNLQNLLFAVECLEVRNMETIGGQGYALVPKLLIPRILWPNKPRTHEGQDLLNIHFQRQSYEQSRTTFYAWGLLAEAIGNFGMWFGPAVLGIMLGLVSGAIESWSIKKSLLSLEGFAASMLFVFAIISFEMNLSILVTSLAQSLFVLLVCGAIIRDFANRFVEKN